MKNWIFYIILLVHSIAYAQENEFKLIGPGIDLKADHLPMSIHFKFIHEKKPSFIVRYTQGEYAVEDLDILPLNSYTYHLKVKILHEEIIKSLKLGYVVFKEMNVHHIKYISIYGDYAFIRDDLNITITDVLFNRTVSKNSINNHYFSGEVEFYGGKRFSEGHLCFGMSIFLGYLGKPTTLFTDVIHQYQPVHTYYFPDRGWGFYPFFINGSLSFTYAF